MKFRDYGEVKPITISEKSKEELDSSIEILGRKFNIIDLQFSTTTLANGGIHYSALALVSVIEEK